MQISGRFSKRTLGLIQPSLGLLVELSGENYHRLMALAPAMKDMHGSYSSQSRQSAGLVLEVREHTAYTSLVYLSHHFTGTDGLVESGPNAHLRLYHDAQQLDVLAIDCAGLAPLNLYVAPSLLNKWRANRFLSKWLAYCQEQQHGFVPATTPAVMDCATA